eukprot:scaffold10148_cov30-Phaeocystis_antarctica.AAC.1
MAALPAALAALGRSLQLTLRESGRLSCTKGGLPPGEPPPGAPPGAHMPSGGGGISRSCPGALLSSAYGSSSS